MIKNISFHKVSYIPEPYRHSKNKIKVETNLSNFTIKYDLKSAKNIDTSKFFYKADLASLKSDAVKLDFDKLETTPAE